MKENPGGIWNLTPMQWATVARSAIAPEGGFYIQQWITEWPSGLNRGAWRRSWEILTERHDALRASFEWRREQQLCQRFAQAEELLRSIEITEIEGASSDPSSGSPELDDFLARDRKRGFDFQQPPLWRLTLIQWRSGGTTCVWTFHHALLDGRSHVRVWREACILHNAIRTGSDPRPESLLPHPQPFSAFVDWLSNWPGDSAVATQYWRNRLAGFSEAVELPTLSTELDSGSYSGAPTALSRVLAEDTVKRLKSGAERFGVTLNALVQGAWILALARYNGVEDVVIGTTRACRHWTTDAPSERVGLFINTVPFRGNAAAGRTVGSFLRDLREQQLALRAGEFASADQIRSWCNLASSTALLRTVLMFENQDTTPAVPDSAQNGRLIEKTDVLTLAAVAGRELTLTFDFSPRRHTPVQIERTLLHLEQLLTGLAEASETTRLDAVDMFAPGERRLLLDTWQGAPCTECALARPLTSVLEEIASRQPGAPAVEFEGNSWSYAELHQRANQLARRLTSTVPAGSRIAVFLDQSMDQVGAWLAVLKAGLVYAPIDPATPAQRLGFFLRDLDPALVLCHQALRHQIPPESNSVPILILDAPEQVRELAHTEGSNPAVSIEPSAPSSLLYTSGSTGVPKAAINSIGGLDNFAAELRRRFNLGPGDRVLQSSSTSFDASLFDLTAALQSGATLVLVPHSRLRAGPGLQQVIEQKRITVTLLTPSVMRSTPTPSGTLRILISAGEILTQELAVRWGTNRRLFNVCGPTECSVWTHCEEVDPTENQPTIGRLLPNCRGYVLDASGEPVPVGVPGELYLGGAAVGVGYWNRPELTSERFLPDRFTPGEGRRMYRTGDRVRWLADGRFEYLGRFDNQVKIQGVRVELGEIEAALRSHPGILDAAVALHEQRPYAWLIARAEPPTPASLRSWISLRIPLLFEPVRYQFVAELPQTRTGKVDRAQLAAGLMLELAQASEPAGSTRSRPLTPEERNTVLRKWNATSRPYPLHRSVVNLIEEQAALRPGSVALHDGSRTLTFEDFNRQANRIARQLLQRGLAPSEVVAIRLPRCIEFAVAALGVMKAGGAYMPLEIDVPSSRQTWLLADSGARFAISHVACRESFTEWNGCSATMEEWLQESSVVDPGGDANPAVPSDPRRLAYVIYTSGSTGTPKGVEVEHHSLSNLVFFYHERLGYTPEDRVTLIANPVFDASVGDLWPGLCAGARVLIPDPGVLDDPDRFIAWLAEGGATYSFAPTAFGELALSRPWPSGMALRHLTIGGDTMRCRPPEGLGFEVLNTYGPTENTVDSIWSVVSTSSPQGAPPIGRPISNVLAYVLDDQRQLVPPGVAGELYLGGEQVARGYRNRPDLTAAAFLPDPFTEREEARMYRTGDRVRWNSNGELEFIGRNDDQIQIRGKRVELGEIEVTLRKHPALREVCCRPLRDGEEVSGVVAHVVLNTDGIPEGAVPDAHSIQQYVAEHLPGYMVPGRIVFHRQLPLTPQGKVDRNALARLQSEPLQAATHEPLPEDSLERALTRLWHRILPHSAGAQTGLSFFEYGGDSLLAVKLLIGVYEITGRRLALSTFLLNPTLEGLRRYASDAELESKVPVITLRKNPGSPHPPVFCMHELFGDVNSYIELADILGDAFSIYGVRSPAIHDIRRAPESIEAAAAQIRAWIRQIHPTGPYLLLGYSWGGLLAFEVARQCVREEGFAPFCTLIGTQAPPRNPSIGERLLHVIRAIPPWLHHFFRDHGQRMRRIFSAGAFLRRLKRNLTAPPSAEPHELSGWAASPLARIHVDLMVRYRPAADQKVPLHLIREKGSFRWKIHPSEYWWTDHEEDGGWRRWARCIPEVIWMDGYHEDVMKPPQVSIVAAALREKLERHLHSTPER